MPTVINPKPFYPVHCCAEVDGASLPGVPEMMGQGKHGVAQLTCPVCFFSRASWEQLRITKALWRSMRWGSLCEEGARTTRKDYVSWGKLVRTNHFLKFCSRILFLPPAFCWAFSRLNASLRQKLTWLFLYAYTGKTTGIPIHVFGTETHMTAIVGMALGHRPIPNQPPAAAHTANFLLNASGSPSVSPFPSMKGERLWGASWRQLTLSAQVKNRSWPPLYLHKALRKLKWLCLHGLSGGALPTSKSLVQKIWSLKTNNVTLASTENLVI